jgi:TolB-like protein
MLQLRALGTPVLEVGNGPARGVACQRKALALLGLLAVAGERGLSRERLLAYLWPETATDRASHRLTQLLYIIRRDFQADDLFLGAADLRLNSALLTSDIATFTDALARGDYATAVSAYGGHFLDGFFLDDAPEFERWVDGERARLAHRYGEALEALARAAEREGDQIGAAEWWRRRVDCEPLNGRAVARCMEALDCVGERGEALRLGRAHETRMREDLDALPDPEVLTIMARLRSERAPAALTVRMPTRAPLTSVAVFPFVNLSPDREGEYFSDGLTDELIDALARVPGLKVAARTSVFAFKGVHVDASEMGARLGVGALIEGTVRLVGRRVRLVVRLIDATENCQRWSGTYERTLDDVFAMQAELAEAVVAALPLSAPAGTALAAPPATQDPEAYDLYLRGRYSVLKRTPTALALAVEYFDQAVERDPEYAVAYASLAEAWVLSGFAEFGTVPPTEAMPKARTAALQAQRLDPTLAEPYLWLGAVRMVFDWDLPSAGEAFRKAQELRPDAAYAAMWYALYLSVSRKHDEALRLISRARSLEPLSLNIQIGYVRICIYAGRYEDAVRHAAALHAAEPDHALVTVWLAHALITAGRPLEAVSILDRMPVSIRSLRASYVVWLQIIALVMADERERAEQMAARNEGGLTGPVEVAGLLLLGRTDRAVATLERLIHERSGLLMFSGSAVYTALHAEPRTAALLRRIGVPLE